MPEFLLDGRHLDDVGDNNDHQIEMYDKHDDGHHSFFCVGANLRRFDGSLENV